MKTLIRFLSVFPIALFPHVLNASGLHPADAGGTHAIPIHRLAQDVSSFSAQNQTIANVRWINIHLSDGSYAYINVTGGGTFFTSLIASAYECSIHGQSFGPDTPTRIIIDLHTSVRVTWTGNVIMIDDLETN